MTAETAFGLIRMNAKNRHAVALGRLGGKKGGKSRSIAKLKACRENGKLGGRPAKIKRERKTVA